MPVSPTEILNLRLTAETKASGAVGFLRELDGVQVSLDDLEATLERFNFFDFEVLVKDITAYLDDLVALKDQDPSEPAGLGIFSIENAPTFVSSDLAMLRTALQSLLQVIDTLPNKVTEAVAIADALYTILYADLTLGGYGITSGDEEALVNRVRDRELREAGITMEEIRQKAASLGYVVPPGAMNAAILESIQKARGGISEANREIYIKRADLFRDNRKFTIEQARAVADFYIKFTSQKAEMLNTVATSQLAEAKLNVDVFLGELQAWEAKVNKVIKEQGLIGDIYKLRVGTWQTKVDATATTITAITEANKVQAFVQQAIADGKLKELAVALDVKKEDFSILVSKCHDMGAAYTQLAAALVSSIDGIMAVISESTED